MHAEAWSATASMTHAQDMRGPFAAYPNAGEDAVAPEALLASAKGWVAQGAQVAGGCCGLGPAHIRVLKAGLMS
jgi:S-methylmethionine-dependent homocysteine/selenocysteine methylase